MGKGRPIDATFPESVEVVVRGNVSAQEAAIRGDLELPMDISTVEWQVDGSGIGRDWQGWSVWCYGVLKHRDGDQLTAEPRWIRVSPPGTDAYVDARWRASSGSQVRFVIGDSDSDAVLRALRRGRRLIDRELPRPKGRSVGTLEVIRAPTEILDECVAYRRRTGGAQPSKRVIAGRLGASVRTLDRRLESWGMAWPPDNLGQE